MEQLVKTYKVTLYEKKELIDVTEYPGRKFICYFRSHDLITRLNGIDRFGVIVYGDSKTEFKGKTPFIELLSKETWKQIEKDPTKTFCQSIRQFPENFSDELAG